MILLYHENKASQALLCQDSSWRVWVESVAVGRNFRLLCLLTAAQQWSGRRGQRGAQVSRIIVSLLQYFSSRTHQRENQQCQMREPSIWLLPQVKARRGLRICVVCQCGGYPSSSAFGAPELFPPQSWSSPEFHKWSSRGATKATAPFKPATISGDARGLADRSGFHCGEVWGRLRRGRPVTGRAGS